MYIVGYIDDEKQMIGDYEKRLSRHDINMIVAPEGSLNDIKDWIVKNKVECMIIDYQLRGQYEFVGTELFSYLADELPGLPCIILTSYTDSSVNENLVVKNCIFDRDIMAAQRNEFDDFCNTIKQSTKVFKNNLEKYHNKYDTLYKTKSKRQLTTEEEENLLSSYRILRAYGEIDDMPAQLLTSSVNEALDEVLAKLDELLKV